MPARRARPCPAADHAMQVWAEWLVSSRERGWPRVSCEVRAYERAQEATNVRGIARYRLPVDGMRKLRDPPDMPKETRAHPGARIPDIDRARVGPRVDRLLQDLSVSQYQTAEALRVQYLFRRYDALERAHQVAVGPRRYFALVDLGLCWLERELRRRKDLDKAECTSYTQISYYRGDRSENPVSDPQKA